MKKKIVVLLFLLLLFLISIYYTYEKLPNDIYYEFNKSMKDCMKNGVIIDPLADPLIESQSFKQMLYKLYKPCKALKIAIVSMFITDKTVPYYAQKTKEILQNYCNIWGYELYYFNEIIDNNYTIMWQKQNAVKKVMDLNKHDYIVWIDADIIILNTSIPIENFIDIENKDIYLSKDIRTQGFWSFRKNVHHYINAGLFIIKNSFIGKKYIDEILEYYDAFNGYFKNNHFHEQSIMQYLYFNKYYPYTLIFPHTVLQTIYSQNIHNSTDFSLHMAGDSESIRNNIVNIYLSNGFYAIPKHKYGFWK